MTVIILRIYVAIVIIGGIASLFMTGEPLVLRLSGILGICAWSEAFRRLGEHT